MGTYYVWTEDDEIQFFMGGLSDGFGENYCQLDWPWKDGVKFDEVEVFDVTPFDFEEHLEREERFESRMQTVKDGNDGR